MERAAQIKREVARAAANAEKLPISELKKICAAAREFILSLPPEKRGAFYWQCPGLECLAILIPALEEEQ